MLTSNGANCTGKEVHLPNEIGHKGVIRIMVDLIRGPNLLNKSVPHNSQTVANSHGLFLIMGHKDRGHVGDFLNPPDFGPHMPPQFSVKIRQGFIQEQNLWIIDQGTGHGHPLLLAAGESCRAGVAAKNIG